MNNKTQGNQEKPNNEINKIRILIGWDTRKGKEKTSFLQNCLHHKYLTSKYMAIIRITMPTTDKSMHRQEHPPFVRLFKIARFFCTRCFSNKRKTKIKKKKKKKISLPHIEAFLSCSIIYSNRRSVFR